MSLEGKELEGKIGDVGSYFGDITPDIKLAAGAKIDFEKDLVAKLPGALKVKASLSIEIDGDPIAVALLEIGKIDSPIAKLAVKAIEDFRAAHPAPVAVEPAKV